MEEILELIAKYSQSRAKDFYKEIDETQLAGIKEGLKNLPIERLENIFNQVFNSKEVPEIIRKEVEFEYVLRGGELPEDFL